MLKEIEKYISVKKNHLFTTDVAMKCKEEATDGEIECYFRTVRKNRGLNITMKSKYVLVLYMCGGGV